MIRASIEIALVVLFGFLLCSCSGIRSGGGCPSRNGIPTGVFVTEPVFDSSMKRLYVPCVAPGPPTSDSRVYDVSLVAVCLKAVIADGKQLKPDAIEIVETPFERPIQETSPRVYWLNLSMEGDLMDAELPSPWILRGFDNYPADINRDAKRFSVPIKTERLKILYTVVYPSGEESPQCAVEIHPVHKQWLLHAGPEKLRRDIRRRQQ